MSEKAFGINVKLLATGCFVCSLAGLLFVVLDQFSAATGSFTIIGMALVCIGLCMGALALMRKEATTPVTTQGGQPPEKP